MSVNLRSFRASVKKKASLLKRFLTKMEKARPRGFRALAEVADQQTWKETDCLSCANCCKTMSPTYTKADLKRISAHFNMSPEDFKKKWLRKDRSGDYLNKTEPCQFLNLENNYCTIYEIRPADCAGFPHHTKKQFGDYAHVFKQNVAYCPATFRWVEKMKAMVEESSQ